MRLYLRVFDENGRSVGVLEVEPRVVTALPPKGERDGEMVFHSGERIVYIWDGSAWKTFAVGLLSDLVINTDKDWGGYNITNLGASSSIGTNLIEHQGRRGVADGYAPLDANALLPAANFPIVPWSKLNFFGVRQEVLAEFSEPKLLLVTSNMNALDGDKVEYAAGNVSSTSEELTVVGGTATSGGDSWMYWDLPKSTQRLYVRALMQALNGGLPVFNLQPTSGSALGDRYNVYIDVLKAAGDFRLAKVIAGVGTSLAVEGIDLTTGTYYDVEFYYYSDGVTAFIKVWRDGILKFDVTDTDITSLFSVGLRCYDESTAAAWSAKFKGQIVVIYE